MYRSALLSVVALTALASSTDAGTVSNLSPVSYDMVNGRSGFGTYRDDTYNGSGNPNLDSSFLSGGLGQLTDGVIGTDDIFDNNFFDWVGWLEVQPVITFDFGAVSTIDSISVRAASVSLFGDVDIFGTMTVEGSINGTDYFPVGTRTTSAGERADPAAQWLALDTTGTQARYLRASFADGDQPWLFFSEVAFTGVPTPGVATVAFAALTFAARRRR
ncbi:MAG: hypothetical protein ACKVZJ_06690 [Phycisphaerales bacterium]